MTNIELLAENVKRGKSDIDEIYNKGYEDGKAEGGGTWDFTKYLTSMQLNASVVEITDNIYFDLSAFGTGLNYFASNVPFSCEKITVKLSDNTTSIQGAFSNFVNVAQDKLKEIEIIGSTGGITSFSSTFCRTNLERITSEIDFSSCTYNHNCFFNATSLKELRIKPNSIKISISFSSSSDLTDESINSIVNGYADMTGQTAPVLTVHATVKSKIIADDAKDDTDPTKRFWLRTLTSKNVTLA